MRTPQPILEEALPFIPSVHINGTQTSQLLPPSHSSPLPEAQPPILPPILRIKVQQEDYGQKPPPYSSLPRLHTSTTPAEQRHIPFASMMPSPDCDCGGAGFWGENDGSECEHEAGCMGVWDDGEEDDDVSWGVREIGYAMFCAFIILAVVLNMDMLMGWGSSGTGSSDWSGVYGVGDGVYDEVGAGGAGVYAVGKLGDAVSTLSVI